MVKTEAVTRYPWGGFGEVKSCMNSRLLMRGEGQAPIGASSMKEHLFIYKLHKITVCLLNSLIKVPVSPASSQATLQLSPLRPRNKKDRLCLTKV